MNGLWTLIILHMLINFHKRKEVGCPASLTLLFMWVPSFADQDPFKRSVYSVTLVSKAVRCGWPPLPDVLAASCSAPGSQFLVVLLCAVSKRNGDVCVLCFMCCFWLTACCRLRTKHHKYLPEVVVIQNLHKINAKSRKNLSLAFGMHLAGLD